MEIENKIKNRATEIIDFCNELYDLNLPKPIFSFNLKGKAAGKFQQKANKYFLKFNKEMLQVNGWEEFESTVAHEVAHFIARKKCDFRIKPHGFQWKKVMYDIGYNPDVTHNLKLSPTVTKEKKYRYTCKCQTHNLSKIQHQRMQKGYFKGRPYELICKSCKNRIKKI